MNGNAECLSAGELRLMQEDLRLPVEQIRRMIDYVRGGGLFDEASLTGNAGSSGRAPQLIALTSFEDGRHYVRDGLHRSIAIWLGRPQGRLDPSEYRVESMTYSMFQTVNLPVGFVTPFDPRTEVRRADLSDFKHRVQQLHSRREELHQFIADNRQLYALPRCERHESIAIFVRSLSWCRLRQGGDPQGS